MKESSHCGVGLLASLHVQSNHKNLQLALKGLKNLEHRGGKNPDPLSGDGAGIMTDIPYQLLGIDHNKMAVGTLFLPQHQSSLRKSLRILEHTFDQYGLKINHYRDVPINPEALCKEAQETLPIIKQFFISRPHHCRTLSSFDKLLYLAKQLTSANLKNSEGIDLPFVSLSSRTIVYKALSNSFQLEEFYPDLRNTEYKITFALFHRRFSTNTISTWDKIQPFRLIAHNGEINTISGNRTWAVTRERALGLRKEELLRHEETSDSQTFNDMVEALKYRSSNHKVSELLALLVPPAQKDIPFYNFWARALEPWDGPALIAYCDGKTLGARLDRNGFRPCRWAKTQDYFVMASEAGAFEFNQNEIMSRGSLSAGQGFKINVTNGKLDFDDPAHNPDNEGFYFDARIIPLYNTTIKNLEDQLKKVPSPVIFGHTPEDLKFFTLPMATSGLEPLGSMGDTSTIAVLSLQDRSIYDYFYQRFAQVTNPPLDYIREKLVTDLRIHLGRRPNIFDAKEMLPPKLNIELSSPILTLGQMEAIESSEHSFNHPLKSLKISILFKKEEGEVGLRSAIEDVTKKSVEAIRSGTDIVILSDRKACAQNPPIPAIIALRAVHMKLNSMGIRMRASLILETGDIKNSHHVAILSSFGATAVCPYLLYLEAHKHVNQNIETTQQNIKLALEQGLLKIMSKMGISVLRSYQGSQLFTPIGLSNSFLKEFFPQHFSIIEGVGLETFVDRIMKRADQLEMSPHEELPHPFIIKEHSKEQLGEKHSMSAKRSRFIHEMLLYQPESQIGQNKYLEFLKMTYDMGPFNIRDLLGLDYSAVKSTTSKQEIEIDEILKTFGSGAMSFGAISAQSQRDLILAMKEIKGRSNSGEGGENPYFYTDGVSASIKQLASGRFGVSAHYLVHAQEIQLKMAQGAKPGEGGQLMGNKVNAQIAKARNTLVGVDLISPPPMHDIYSIEDLKQLIYELKQLHPHCKISVKLVSGENIGHVAIGVVKAGADIIHISGGDSGTGAAGLLSMKHCGLPWEFGLAQTHRTLLEHGLRSGIILRVDGSLQTGKDIILAAILGADEFDFGKMLLIAQGCVMARVCHKNTCPAGIATQDPKFQERYKGNAQKVIDYLRFVAIDIKNILIKLGQKNLKQLKGKSFLLKVDSFQMSKAKAHHLDLAYFTQYKEQEHSPMRPHENTEEHLINDLNRMILDDVFNEKERDLTYQIKSTDRAIPCTLFGQTAYLKPSIAKDRQQLTFSGSAGQGFCAFMTDPYLITLKGEANDGVGKSMSGGMLVITPHDGHPFKAQETSIIGNGAFYGATKGKAFIYGMASDRFAIRNSGALLIVEGVGLHACEYMTGGTVIILGNAGKNLGAGMTGGVIFSIQDLSAQMNGEYITQTIPTDQDTKELLDYLKEYESFTSSPVVTPYLKVPESIYRFYKYAPITRL